MDLLTPDLWRYLSQFGCSFTQLQTASKNYHLLAWSEVVNTLVISYNRKPTRTAQYFAQAPKTSTLILRGLRFGKNEEKLFDLIPTLPCLTDLQLVMSELPPEGLPTLAALPSLTKLVVRPWFNGHRSTGILGETFIGQLTHCTRLTSLELGYAVYTDKGVGVLASLTNLTLLSCRGGSSSCTTLSPFTALQKLTNLQLRNLDFGVDPGLSYDWMLALPNLKFLTIFLTRQARRTSWLTPLRDLAGLNRFKFAWGECHLDGDLDPIRSLKELTHLELNAWSSYLENGILDQLTNLRSLTASFGNFAEFSVLSSLTNLTKLSIVQEDDSAILRLKPKYALALNHLTRLETFKLGGHDSRPRDGAFLSALTLTSIRVLDLSGFSLPPEVMPALGRLPHLVTLDLPDCGLRDVHFSEQAWPNLSNLQSLQQLDLSSNKLSNIGMSYFSSQISGLQSINLSHNASFSNRGLLELSASNPNLTAITLMKTGTWPEGYEALASLNRLYYLSLYHPAHTHPTRPPTIATWAKLTSLKALDLQHNPDEELILLKNHQFLEHLDLGCDDGICPIKGHGLIHLQHLPIRFLNLSKCDSFHPRNLEVLTNFQSLTELWLPKTDGPMPGAVPWDTTVLERIPKLRKIHLPSSPRSFREWGIDHGVEVGF